MKGIYYVEVWKIWEADLLKQESSVAMAGDFYVRYYVGHKGKFGHEFLEFEFRPDGMSVILVESALYNGLPSDFSIIMI